MITGLNGPNAAKPVAKEIKCAQGTAFWNSVLRPWWKLNPANFLTAVREFYHYLRGQF